MTTRIVVSVQSGSGSHLLDLPDDARLEDLLPGIVKACEGGQESTGWTLAPQGEPALRPEQTLGEVGLFAGAVMLLAPPPPVVVTPASPPPPRLESMSEAEYRRTLDRAIQAPGGNAARASAVIAIAADHPGAGATTVTALLAMLFTAVRDERVAVVDANPESGALSQWLVPDAALRPDVYRSLFQRDVTPAAVSGALVGAGPRLAVLPSGVEATTQRNEDSAAWTRLIEHLRRLHHLVLLDCGAGLRRPAVQACLAAADQVVLVTRRAEPGDLGMSKPLVLVVNQAARRSRTNRSGLGVPQVTLTLDTRSAALLKRGGFAWSQTPGAWQEAVRELAALLVASG